LAALKIPQYTPLTVSTINTSYRILALKHHPDTTAGATSTTGESSSSSSSSSSSKFIELTASRDYLLAYINTKPELSDRRHPKHASRYKVQSTLHEYARFADNVANNFSEQIRAIKEQRLRNLSTKKEFEESYKDSSEATTTASGELRKELLEPLTSALDRAYHGPTLPFQIEPTNTQWPCSFELESLLDSKLQPDAATTAPALASDAHLEIIFGRTLLGSMSLTLGSDEPQTAHDCTLDLTYCGGENYMRAVRARVPDSEGEFANNYSYSTSVYSKDDELLYRIDDDAGYRSSFFGFSDKKIKRKRRNLKVYSAGGTLLYTLLFVNTPGVKTVYFHNVRTGSVDCRVSKARLLPTDMWAWEPRSNTHGGKEGSWVVENKAMKAMNKHVVEVDFDESIEVWKGGVNPGVVVVIIGMLCINE
jgi:hypothetical protein